MKQSELPQLFIRCRARLDSRSQSNPSAGVLCLADRNFLVTNFGMPQVTEYLPTFSLPSCSFSVFELDLR
jgi:hypothetical protein